MKRFWIALGATVLLFIAGAVGGFVAHSRDASASRNSAGTYSLSTSPVVSNQVISSSLWNSTFSDLAASMTDSADRNGRGGFLAPVRGIDGTVSAPAFSYTSDTGLGEYRIGSGDLGWAVGGVKKLELTSALFTVVPAASFSSTLALADSLTITKSGSASDVAASLYEASLANGNNLQLRLGVAASNNASGVLSFNLNATAANSTACLSVFGQNSTLCVDGNAKTFVASDFAINTNKFTVAGSSGNTVVAGTLVVGSGSVSTVSGFSRGGCTLNGASPAVCTLSVVSGQTCTASFSGTTAPPASGLRTNNSAGTVTVTGANGLTDGVNITCF